MKNTLVILTFKDRRGELTTVKNPELSIVDLVENSFPNSILKVYDFETGEIITLYNENFSWHELAYSVNNNLKSFSNVLKKGA